MTLRNPVVSLLLYGFAVSTVNCLAHEQPIHVKISNVAALNSAGLGAFLSDDLGPQYIPFDAAPFLTWDQTIGSPIANSPVEWLKEGSYHEDDEPRFLNHFYQRRSC
jgi:hypothetical protein